MEVIFFYNLNHKIFRAVKLPNEQAYAVVLICFGRSFSNQFDFCFLLFQNLRIDFKQMKQNTLY